MHACNKHLKNNLKQIKERNICMYYLGLLLLYIFLLLLLFLFLLLFRYNIFTIYLIFISIYIYNWTVSPGEYVFIRFHPFNCVSSAFELWQSRLPAVCLFVCCRICCVFLCLIHVCVNNSKSKFFLPKWSWCREYLPVE